ncbi:N-acetyltransferase [Phycicoccus sp. Root101]|uniref:GNAT family N-acetyltransferase n=1 Tax=Phycicoccus sp. Root101 TaxID=1736421 RepID=UPI000702CBA6|nr:GNAT family protein [Phycicoccus sp. Root101]KQU68734.1 GCN5 family acetyltransferase [Phycicoccus sp. Root101]
MTLLRPLRRDDLEELLVVQREGAVLGLGHIFPQDDHPFPTDQLRERWSVELEDPEVRCYAVVVYAAIEGFAATRDGEFLHFGTAVATWGSGLAGRVHDEVLATLHGQGHEHAWLRVYEENHRATRFYARRGWQPTEVTSRSTFAPYALLRRWEITLGD